MKINLYGVLFAFIILYLVFQIREDVLRYNGLVSGCRKLEAVIKETVLKNQSLKSRIASLDDGQFIECLARERLIYVKKGEKAFKICRLKSDKM
ncbi:MAG: hypothetical protein FD145_599 [Candidatus Saganbacteria bacterium]|uniref:Septum formation initiator family protein n=1 Tax=Candidatus Saganbacteria bacterium TaxID=2575572 RepID=A0A833P066_UNCSA|nr:MAG: hypothetical protein FD145_599 [Candidatus Saganbacteria bacterium]